MPPNVMGSACLTLTSLAFTRSVGRQGARRIMIRLAAWVIAALFGLAVWGVLIWWMLA